MTILTISANPLLIEAVADALAECCATGFRSAPPEQALACLAAQQPDVVLLDDALPAGLLRQIVQARGRKDRMRVILFSSTNNDLFVLETAHIELTGRPDLIKWILSGEQDTGSQAGRHAG